ncbi:MAG: hypothetical protein AAGH15_00005 [Myxococcota bacterium]
MSGRAWLVLSVLVLAACGRTTLELGDSPGLRDAGVDLTTDGPGLDLPPPIDLGRDMPGDMGGPDIGFDIGLDMPVDMGRPDLGGPCGGDDCSGLDGACVVGRCDPDADVCVAIPRAEGTECDDGQACTVDDFCRRGVCTGRGPDCSAFDSACTVGVCDDATGACAPSPVPNGTLCEDGDLCTLADTCRRGTCRPGVPRDCTDVGDACNAGICNPMTGACGTIPLVDGTPCDDGLVCTDGDSCRMGVCTAGADVLCDAFDDVCLVGTCVEDAGGCVALPAPEGSPCDDDDACTTADACRMGACIGGPPPIIAGDTCADAIGLLGTDGLQSLDGSTECASATTRGTCGGGGPELFYELELTAPRRVRFETLPPMSARFDTTLYVREECAAPPTQLFCDDDGGAGTLSRIDEVFQAGTYSLTVDGWAAAFRGDFELEVDIEEPDTCATAVSLDLPGVGETTTISGTTAGATNALESTCGSLARSPDHVYEIEVTTRTTLRFETVAPFAYDTTLHVRGAPCATSATLFCDDDDGVGRLSLIEGSFDPGTYYVVVDGFATASSGAYQLEVENLGLRGQAVLVGHDYFASSVSQDRVVGNAVLLTDVTGTIDILEYTEFADTTPGGEAENTRGAIDRTVTAAGQSTRYTALTNFRNLATSLTGRDVLLVHEQEQGAFPAVTVRDAWRTTLFDFLDRGGIVVVIASSRDEWQIVNLPGLFTVTSDAPVPATPPNLVIAAPGDPLLAGVAAYVPGNATTSLPGATGGTTVIETSTGDTVVLRVER